ncbi:MAG: alpha/beta hydrolase-fold protein [Elusimicrobiota bacterium]
MKINGTLLNETLGSVVLKGNPLGDPRLREVPVYVPPSYFKDRVRRYPVVYFLTGFIGTPKGVVDTHPWKESLVERLDRLIAAGEARESILVIPDCFTRYGGSQYINSEGAGRYEDHIVSELVPYIDDKYRTPGAAEGRAVMGKSSGGYGALVLGMRHPDVFGHVVCHSGDMFFEMSYASDFPKCVNALAQYGGSFARFVREFGRTREKIRLPHSLVGMAGMSCCYSPNPKSPMGFDIPFDESTGETVPKVFKRWQAHDPVRLAARHAGGLKRLRTLFFDCGTRDEYYLHLGARKLSRELKRLGVRHVYEEHPFGHSDMNERYDEGFKRLSEGFRKAGA